MDKFDPDALFVIHGFLALPNRSKMQVVNAMNEYFDSDEKEKLRTYFDETFAEMRAAGREAPCLCCGE